MTINLPNLEDLNMNWSKKTTDENIIVENTCN